MKLPLIAALVLTTLATSARAANPIVVMDTSMGMVKIELFEDKAPVTVKNFLSYVDDKFFDNTIFHRVMGKESYGRDYIVQGGGYEPGLREKPSTKEPIINESGNGVKNQRGTIAAARKPLPNSATSQFFVNLADNAALDKANAADNYGYAVFGKIIEGMEVVDKIKAVKTGPKSGHAHVPLEDVVIKTARRQAENDPPKP